MARTGGRDNGNRRRIANVCGVDPGTGARARTLIGDKGGSKERGSNENRMAMSNADPCGFQTQPSLRQDERSRERLTDDLTRA